MPDFVSGLDVYSDQITNLNAVERSLLDGRESGGRVRIARFSFNTGSTALDSTPTAKVIGLIDIHGGHEIIMVHAAYEAMGTGATCKLGFCELDGTVIDDDAIAGSFAVAAVGTKTYYPIVVTAGRSGYFLTERSVLCAEAAGADWAANKDFKGFVLYA